MSVQSPIQQVETTDAPLSRRDRIAAGVALIAIGLLVTASQLFTVNLEGWVFMGALAAIFLAWGLFTRSFGLIIPGGVLGGIGFGAFLTSLPGTGDSVFLLGFAAGWALISLLSTITAERIQWWPLIPGGIIAAVGVLVMAGEAGQNVLTVLGFAWPLVLVAAGVAILIKRR